MRTRSASVREEPVSQGGCFEANFGERLTNSRFVSTNWSIETTEM